MNTTPLKISANIITLNEEHNIAEVIKSAQQVCDEIIVVDSLSTDRTREIAKELGAIVIEQPFLGDGEQKAQAAKYAKNDWLISIDGDERLDADAVQAIRNLDLENSEYEAYSFRRKTFIGKNYIKLWYPDKVTRLYNKNHCNYSHKYWHAKVESNKIKELNAHILHYSYKDYIDMIRTTEKYIKGGAKVAHDEGKIAKFYDPFTHGLGALIKHLIFKGGAFHGINGWNVSIISAYSSYMKYAIMLDIQRNGS